MNEFTILNYQGSKKNLLEFIHQNVNNYLSKEKAFFDIFSGTSIVGYSFKEISQIYANDLELYSYYISKAVLGKRISNINNIIRKLTTKFDDLFKELGDDKRKNILNEKSYIIERNTDMLVRLYENHPTIWNGKVDNLDKNKYTLFLDYYAGTYFGIKQSIEIDTIRELIDDLNDEDLVSKCIASAFFAMKEVVFSKDGHMAQPLSIIKNTNKFYNVREKSVFEIFISKLKEFSNDSFNEPTQSAKIFNKDFIELLRDETIWNSVGVVYADPPYTDMQYSRYYHILNVFARYDYPKPTIGRNGFTKGLYTENRNQSRLSQKSKSLDNLTKLIEKCFESEIVLVFSFAYPINVANQKTNRYVFNVDDLIDRCKSYYSNDNVIIKTKKHKHSNNRNKKAKKVNEYLIICKPGDVHAD